METKEEAIKKVITEAHEKFKKDFLDAVVNGKRSITKTEAQALVAPIFDELLAEYRRNIETYFLDTENTLYKLSDDDITLLSKEMLEFIKRNTIEHLKTFKINDTNNFLEKVVSEMQEVRSELLLDIFAEGNIVFSDAEKIKFKKEMEAGIKSKLLDFATSRNCQMFDSIIKDNLETKTAEYLDAPLSKMLQDLSSEVCLSSEEKEMLKKKALGRFSLAFKSFIDLEPAEWEIQKNVKTLMSDSEKINLENISSLMEKYYNDLLNNLDDKDHELLKSKILDEKEKIYTFLAQEFFRVGISTDLKNEIDMSDSIKELMSDLSINDEDKKSFKNTFIQTFINNAFDDFSFGSNLHTGVGADLSNTVKEGIKPILRDIMRDEDGELKKEIRVNLSESIKKALNSWEVENSLEDLIKKEIKSVDMENYNSHEKIKNIIETSLLEMRESMYRSLSIHELGNEKQVVHTPNRSKIYTYNSASPKPNFFQKLKSLFGNKEKLYLLELNELKNKYAELEANEEYIVRLEEGYSQLEVQLFGKDEGRKIEEIVRKVSILSTVLENEIEEDEENPVGELFEVIHKMEEEVKSHFKDDGSINDEDLYQEFKIDKEYVPKSKRKES